MAHTRQSRPDSGLSFQVEGLQSLLVVPSSLGSGWGDLIAESICGRYSVRGVQVNSDPVGNFDPFYRTKDLIGTIKSPLNAL